MILGNMYRLSCPAKMISRLGIIWRTTQRLTLGSTLSDSLVEVRKQEHPISGKLFKIRMGCDFLGTSQQDQGLESGSGIR